jgi:ParB family chromosome partitioning protein
MDSVTDPSLWAVRIDEESVYTDRETGDVVDEATIDWNTEGQPDAEPIEGLRHADSVLETVGFVAVDYYCLDTAAAGLTPNERFRRFSGEGGTTPTPGIDTLEADKRERRMVLALNRAAEAAQSVRREFVTGILARKTPPKGAMAFTARMLVADPYLLTHHKADATELMGSNFDATEAVKAGDTRAQVIILGLVLSSLEVRTPKQAWRSGTYVGNVGPKEYLGFLAENGYTLSDIEKVMVGAGTPDELYDAMTAEHQHLETHSA